MKFITLNLEEERVENTYTIDKCIRKDKLNGLATVEFSTLNNHLEKYYRLLYKNHKGKWKELIVVSVELIHDITGIVYKVYAEESIVEIKGDFIEDKRNRKATYASCGVKAFENTRWRLVSENSEEKHNLNFYRQSAFQAFNDILKTFNCEFETDVIIAGTKVVDRVVKLSNQIGYNTGKRFTWSKDTEEIKRKINEEDIITALYPYGRGEQVGDGYGRRIDISEVNNGVPYLENLEAKEKYGFLNQDGTRRHRFGKKEYDIEDKAELKAVGKEDLENLSKPNITYTAKVIDLQSLGIDLEGVDIGDSVVIRDKEADITLNARVIELDEDLDNVEETTIVLGNYRPVLVSKIKEMDKSLSQLKSKESLYDRIANLDPDDVVFIDEVIDNLNKEFNAGTSNIFFDENRGLVVTDKPNEEDSNWIMELSSQGFRIANSKKSNGEWDFRTFGTGDGFTADQLIAGVIRGGNSFWNLETGELNIGDMFIIDPNGNATLSQKAKEELKGEPGRTPSININADGYWIIDGTNTNVKAEGIDGHTPKLEISNDGYWVIDGNKSDTHAEAYLLNIVYYPGEEHPLTDNDINKITLNPNENTRWIGINNSSRDKYQDWESKSLDMFDWSKFVGNDGSDAIIISDIEPADKTKLWRKSITDPNLYIYIDDKWVEIDAQLQDIVVQIQEEISGQEDKWQGDINTNIENVINELTNFQSDLKNITDELEGKANIEQVLNEEEVKKTVEDIISKYPEIINLNQHFNFSQEGLRITATDASNKEVDTSVLIKNDGLEIEVEGQAAAYFKQNETLTPNLNVEGTAWVGNHAMLGFNGYDADGSYNENKNITVFAWSPRKKEEDS